jgi:hypothetical protein
MMGQDLMETQDINFNSESDEWKRVILHCWSWLDSEKKITSLPD